MREIKKVKDVWTKGPTVLEDEVEFHSFFDIEDSIENAMKKGFIDFSHKIFTGDFYHLLGDPRDKTALEIGFGGGRLINAASHFFDNVIGVVGASKGYFGFMIFGLVLSVILTGALATYLANYIQKHLWIAYVGLAFILLVAIQLIIGGLVDLEILRVNEEFKKYF